MDTNICTILLDAYSPENNLVAMDGRILGLDDFQNLSAVRRPVQTSSLRTGVGPLLSARGRRGYVVKIYGDAFERRYFTALTNCGRERRDMELGQVETYPLPTSIDAPLEERFELLDAASRETLYSERVAYVALYGDTFATDAWRKRLADEVPLRAGVGWNSAVRHGLGLEFVMAKDPQALMEISRSLPLSAVVMTKADLQRDEPMLQEITVGYDSTRGAIITAMDGDHPEMIFDVDGRNPWFLWGLSSETEVSGALADFLTHAHAKSLLKSLTERITMPTGTADQQKRFHRLHSSRPMLMLTPPTTVERSRETRQSIRWTVPWREAIPEIAHEAAPVFTIHPGEDSVSVTVVGDTIVWRGLDIYDTAEVSCRWNGGLDRARFEIKCVPCATASSNSVLTIDAQWINNKLACMMDDRAFALSGTDIGFVYEWYNAQGEKLPNSGTEWDVVSTDDDQHLVMPEGKLRDGLLVVFFPECGHYRVMVKKGGKELYHDVQIFPSPVGIKANVRTFDSETRVKTTDSGIEVHTLTGAKFAVDRRFVYNEHIVDALSFFENPTEDIPYLPTMYGPENRTGFTVENEQPGAQLFSIGRRIPVSKLDFTFTDDIGSLTDLATHKPCTPFSLTVHIRRDRSIELLIVGFLAVFTCGVCFWYADYGLDGTRTAVYVATTVLLQLIAKGKFWMNRIRKVHYGFIIVIILMFLYELWQEML